MKELGVFLESESEREREGEGEDERKTNAVLWRDAGLR